MIESVGGFFPDSKRLCCDNCGKAILHAPNLEWIDEPLMYSPILCENHGRRMNKFLGDTVQENEKLKKKFKELGLTYVLEELNIKKEDLK